MMSQPSVSAWTTDKKTQISTNKQQYRSFREGVVRVNQIGKMLDGLLGSVKVFAIVVDWLV